MKHSEGKVRLNLHNIVPRKTLLLVFITLVSNNREKSLPFGTCSMTSFVTTFLVLYIVLQRRYSESVGESHYIPQINGERRTVDAH